MCVIGVGAPNNPYGVAGRLGLKAWLGNYEITRVAAHPKAPKNTASKSLALMCAAVRDDFGFDWLFSYADTGQGHHGGIYQALNAVYCGFGVQGGGGVLIVDGRKYHTRSAVTTFGTASRKLIREQGHEVGFVPMTQKHTYILPIGGPASRRAIRKALEPYTLPYPKRDQESEPMA